MIRISVTHEENTFRFKVEGRLAGYGVDELRGALLRHNPQCEFEVDVADITFLDDEGEKLLIWIDRIGGRIRNDGAFANFLLDGLGITVVQPRVERHYLAAQLHPGAILDSGSENSAVAG